MANEMQVFKYAEQHNVRTMLIDGVPYFVGKDVANVLGYSNTNDALIRHVDEEDKLTSRITMAGQGRDVIVINESGLYSLIFASKLPTAKQFKHWVTSEVLPSIRKHGMYLTDEALNAMKTDPESFERVLKLYAEARERERELKKELEDTRPFTNLGRIVLAQSGSVSMQSAAHFLCQHGFETGQNRLFRLFREKKLLCSRKGRQWNQPTQKAIEQGLLNTEISGGFRAVAMVTPKGLQYLTELFANKSYPLLMLIEGETE